MGIILDIIIIAILALSIFFGYKKGLVKVAVSLFALLISIIVTFILYRPVSDAIIKNTNWDENIEKVILENAFKEKDENTESENNGFLENVSKYIDDTVTDAQNNVVENVAKEVSIKIINIISIVGIFVITRLLLILLTLVSTIITSLPIIKQFNELGGVLYGLFRGLVIIYGVLAIVFLTVSVSSNSNIIDIINSSFVTKFMYSNNILLNIIF